MFASSRLVQVSMNFPSAPRNHKRPKEHRFVAGLSRRGQGALALGALGSALLGAALTGQLLLPQAHPSSLWLLGAGLIALVAAWGILRTRSVPIRVGDLGVGFERPGELLRIRWCDVERLRSEGSQLRLLAMEHVIAIPRAEHASAVAWILREAIQRIPEKVEIDKRERPPPPELEPSSGARRVNLVPLQVTGKTYADTGAAVLIERDTLRCTCCAALYHRETVPATCSCCGKALEGNLMAV